MDYVDKVTILGIDPGTANTGFSIVDFYESGEVKLHTEDAFGVIITPSMDDYRERVDIIGGEIEALIKEFTPSYVGIEDFTEQGVNVGKVYKEMATLIESLRMRCIYNSYVPYILENSKWKDLAIGTRGLNKRQVQHFITHKVSNAELLMGQPDHVWDSVGVAFGVYNLIINRG